MARKRSLSAAENFRQLKKCSLGNTKITVDANGNASMYLFGNRIAFRTKEGRVFITTCGWTTTTTISRLRELGYGITRRRELSINGIPWDGRWVEIIEMPPAIVFFKNDPPVID